MKTVKSVLVGASIGALLTAQAHGAVPSNAGFDTGELAGWTYTDGVIEVVTDADDAIVTPPFWGTFYPNAGRLFRASDGGFRGWGLLASRRLSRWRQLQS